jgi:hypothetical protein
VNLTIKQELHREYLQSPLWKAIRQKALDHYGSICGKCGQEGTDVHHLTYRGWGGNEIISDLQVLCRECHCAIHAIEKVAKRGKAKKRVNVQALFGYLTEAQRSMIEKEFGGVCYSVLLQKDKRGDAARVMAKRMLNVHEVYFSKKKSAGRSSKSRRVHY